MPSAPPGPVDDVEAWLAASVALREELRTHVAHAIGPVAKPRHLLVVPEVPKTRSGKIMRRLLAQLVEGTTLGDTTSLQNPWAVEQVGTLVTAGLPR